MRRVEYFCLLLFAAGPACSSTENEIVQLHWLKPYEKDPSYWQYRGEPVLLIGGTDDDNLFQLPHLKDHLDLLASVGGNYVRNTMSSRVDEGFEIYRFKQLPDGKYDLDQWNEEYWRRFENLLNWTDERDIVVQIEVWDRFDYSREHWVTSPWNPSNNINYSFEETGFDPEYPNPPPRDLQPFFHSIPGMEEYKPEYSLFRAYQETYLEKMLSCSLEHGNILYCMNNETSTSPKWGQYWMEFIRKQAKAKGVEVFVTDMFGDFWKGEESDNVRMVFDHPLVYSFVDISQVNSRNFGQDHWDRMQWLISQAREFPRPSNNTKIYGSGNTSWGSGSPKDGVERFWRNVIGGCASARFHRPWAGLGLGDKAQSSLTAVRKMESLVRMWEVEARNDLLNEREPNECYLAAKPGQKYVCYFPNGGSVSLDLRKWAQQFDVRWIDISTGEWNKEETLQGGEAILVQTPGVGDWLAVIISQGEGDRVF